MAGDHGPKRTSRWADLTISREDGFYPFSAIPVCVPGLNLRMAYVTQQLLDTLIKHKK
jgi:hypothetical protein